MRLMLIFQFILGLQSQSIDFTSSFSQADIPNGDPVFIELTRYFNSDGGQCGVALGLNKYYMFNLKPHIFGMKSYEIVC